MLVLWLPPSVFKQLPAGGVRPVGVGAVQAIVSELLCRSYRVGAVCVGAVVVVSVGCVGATVVGSSRVRTVGFGVVGDVACWSCCLLEPLPVDVGAVCVGAVCVGAVLSELLCCGGAVLSRWSCRVGAVAPELLCRICCVGALRRSCCCWSWVLELFVIGLPPLELELLPLVLELFVLDLLPLDMLSMEPSVFKLS